ncbi:titin homolog isoform X1 [Haliotis asinina]|uniref:titin homolog isoform X1 n=2 Tax=Haliotis asinina TaxID=109174 RepID=UPI00353181DD
MAERNGGAPSARPDHGCGTPPERDSWHPLGNPLPPGLLEEWRKTHGHIPSLPAYWAQQQQFNGPVEFRPDWNALQYTGNFSVAMATTQPSNASEWQLYRVLQRANLLQYYDTFIAQGGDDVQQLCEAGEEEFLEIMALVGMASKPLHVRRLQKALQEWVANPGAFQGPGTTQSSSPAPGSITAVVRDQNLGYIHSTPPTSVVNAPTWNPQPAPRSVSPAAPAPDAPSPSSGSPQSDMKDIPVTMSGLQDDLGLNMCGYPMQTSQHSSSPLPTPVLVESQIQSIAEAAAQLSKELPPFDAKELNMKKQINREIQSVMQLTDDDPSRLDELRKYAAIYGRFDSKRKNDRPMSLHEISVNEAAAQLCRHIPTLLTRREDLFPLARQVVRDSGYQYSKGHSSVVKSEILDPRELKAADVVVSKKPRVDPVFQRMHDANPKTVKAELDKIHREERMNCINQDMKRIKDRQEAIKTEIVTARDTQNSPLVQKLQQELETLTAQQLALLTEQGEILRKQKRSERYLMTKPERPCGQYGDDDFTDSSNFPSGNSSPMNSQDGTELDFTKVAVYAANFRSSTAQKFMQETLFDEGLRIAQQYGMADFAEELKELKSRKIPKENGQDSDSEMSDTASESGQNGRKRKHSDSETLPEERNGKREKDDLSSDVKLQHNNNEADIAQAPKSAGFDTSQQNSLQSTSSEESDDDNEADSIKGKKGYLARPNHNGIRNEISEPLQNGD